MGYVYDYSRLKGRIVEKLNNITEFAKAMKLSETTIYSKLSGKVEFKQSEILKGCEILEIPENKIDYYFFYTKS